jgi:probable phosphoglycerate mutase
VYLLNDEKTAMTRFLLIRHAVHVLGHETIAGRSPQARLSEEGKTQTSRLVDRVAHLPIRALYCSPVQRARETAQPLADRLGLKVQISDALYEINFGDWSGRQLDELRPRQQWQQWNSFRSGTRLPAGELMLETQTRIVTEMLRLRVQHPDDCVALVSHGDVIKAAALYFLGVPLDLCLWLEISQASVSVVAIADHGPRVLCVNSTGAVVV